MKVLWPKGDQEGIPNDGDLRVTFDNEDGRIFVEQFDNKTFAEVTNELAEGNNWGGDALEEAWLDVSDYSPSDAIQTLLEFIRVLVEDE